MENQKIFVFNGGQVFGHSGGRFNNTIFNATLNFFKSEPGLKSGQLISMMNMILHRK